MEAGEVGREIRRLREAKGLSQTKVAAAADMGPSGLSQIETGARNPSAVTLHKIATALGVEVADLFPKGRAPSPEEGAARYVVSASDLAALYRNLARRGQSIVEQSVREGASEELGERLTEHHEEAAALARIKGGRDILGRDPEELAEAVEDYVEVESRLRAMLAQDASGDGEQVRSRRLRRKGNAGGSGTAEAEAG